MPRSLPENLVHRKTADPIANDDYSAGFGYGSIWLNESVSPIRVWKCVDPSIGAAVWVQLVTPYEVATVSDNNADPAQFDPATMNNYSLYLSSSANSNFSFTSTRPNGAINPYLEVKATTYTTISTFDFRGTNVWTPNKLLAILSGNRTGNYYLRMYDVTNSNQIVEYNYTSGTQTLYSITGFTNLPATEAIFEFQARAASGKMRVHSAGIYIT